MQIARKRKKDPDNSERDVDNAIVNNVGLDFRKGCGDSSSIVGLNLDWALKDDTHSVELLGDSV